MTDVYMPKAIEVLNVIDREEALHALMTKWILKAPNLGESNLHIFLRYRLSKLKPNKRSKWPQSLQWMLTHKFLIYDGYKVWNKLIQTWKLFASKINFLPSKSRPELLITPL